MIRTCGYFSSDCHRVLAFAACCTQGGSHRLQRGHGWDTKASITKGEGGKEGLESGSRVLWEGGTGFREPPALETVVVAPLRLCGVNLHLSVCSNSTGLVEGGSKPGIPEGQLGGC